MILAIRYSVKGVKKAHKSYKKHQADKEQKMLTERGQLPDLQDPSRELDTSCLTDLSQTKSSSALSRTSSRSSTSTTSAEKALENDPSFKEYMEKQKALYLTHHRSQSHHQLNPPSYHSIMQQQQSPHSSAYSPTSTTDTLYPTSSITGHCSCHDCVRMINSTTLQPRPVTPLPSVPELPPSTDVPAIHVQREATVSELASSNRQPIELMSREEDAGDMIFELPGNMPAILPLKKPETPVELPSEPA